MGVQIPPPEPPTQPRHVRGACHLVMTPVLQTGAGEFDPLAPYPAHERQRGPTSRGCRLKNGEMGVQIPPLARNEREAGRRPTSSFAIGVARSLADEPQQKPAWTGSSGVGHGHASLKRGSDHPHPSPITEPWKSNRERSRARPLPGAYRKVWCSSHLTSAASTRQDACDATQSLSAKLEPRPRGTEKSSGSEADTRWPRLSVKQDL